MRMSRALLGTRRDVIMTPAHLDVLALTAAAAEPSLHRDLEDILADAGPVTVSRAPRDRRDAALALALIHDLHVAPLDELGDRARLQHHPVIAAVKCELEEAYTDRLESLVAEQDWWPDADDPVAAVRAIAAHDQVPALYRWVAEEADREQLVAYLALEGGPDGGFDDLVALCQVGLDGPAKLELATNYWDEMGDGELSGVHTELYRRFVRAVDLPVIPREEQPTEALERALLGTLLATNRVLQPEMVGALGLIELQAGPRCRRVLEGLDRLGMPAEARPFYEEHAVTDPRHGKDWLDKVIGTLGQDPRWAEGMVRGARWRWAVNDQFFRAMADKLGCTEDHR